MLTGNRRDMARMGFSSPSAIAPAPTPAPPPVRMTGQDVGYAQDAQRRKQAARQGYAATLLAAAAPGTEPKKTLLGG